MTTLEDLTRMGSFDFDAMAQMPDGVDHLAWLLLNSPPTYVANILSLALSRRLPGEEALVAKLLSEAPAVVRAEVAATLLMRTRHLPLVWRALAEDPDVEVRLAVLERVAELPKLTPEATGAFELAAGQDPHPEVRAEALWAFINPWSGAPRPGAVPPVALAVASLGDPHPAVRFRAAATILRLHAGGVGGLEAATSPLEQAAADADPWLSALSRRALGAISGAPLAPLPAPDDLRELLRAGGPEVVEEALRGMDPLEAHALLGALGTARKAMAVQLALTRHPDARVRRLVFMLIHRSKTAEVTDALLAAAQADDPFALVALVAPWRGDELAPAVAALGQLPRLRRRAVAALADALARRKPLREDPTILALMLDAVAHPEHPTQGHAADALRLIRAPEAAEPLRRALRARIDAASSWPLTATCAGVSHEVHALIGALGAVEGEAALPALRDAVAVFGLPMPGSLPRTMMVHFD